VELVSREECPETGKLNARMLQLDWNYVNILREIVSIFSRERKTTAEHSKNKTSVSGSPIPVLGT